MLFFRIIHLLPLIISVSLTCIHLKGERGEFCRNDFLAVGLYTLDRVFAITLFYVCLALCVKTTTTRGQGHRSRSSTRIVFYSDSSTDSSRKYFINVPSFRRSRFCRRYFPSFHVFLVDKQGKIKFDD